MGTANKSIVVVGAGLSGLVAAWRLRQLLPTAKITVVEAADRAGGILHTETAGGYLVEHSADMFTTEPADAYQLCRELGHEQDLLTTQPVEQRATIATERGIEPVPQGFSLMLPGDLDAIRASNILDDAGTERLIGEEAIPARVEEADEDFRSFVVRRFGQQAFDHLVQPLVSGIYTADPRRLSMLATMRRFVQMERQHGSLIAAAKASAADSSDRNATGARYDLFRAPRQGMGQLIQWLLAALDKVDVRYRWPVKQIRRQDEGWVIESLQQDQQSLQADAVVVATPVATAGRVLSEVSKELSRDLTSIESASSAVAVLAFDRKQLRRPFEGYGIVVPACLNRQLIAASFSSNKFAERAPEGKMLIRCFIGGAMQGELVDLPDSELVDLALAELDQLIGVDGAPELRRVIRWRNAMPQYHVGHLDRVASIESQTRTWPTLALAGNGYRGVGIPVCVRSGMNAATEIAQACSN